MSGLDDIQHFQHVQAVGEAGLNQVRGMAAHQARLDKKHRKKMRRRARRRQQPDVPPPEMPINSWNPPSVPTPAPTTTLVASSSAASHAEDVNVDQFPNDFGSALAKLPGPAVPEFGNDQAFLNRLMAPVFQRLGGAAPAPAPARSPAVGTQYPSQQLLLSQPQQPPQV